MEEHALNYFFIISHTTGWLLSLGGFITVKPQLLAYYVCWLAPDCYTSYPPPYKGGQGFGEWGRGMGTGNEVGEACMHAKPAEVGGMGERRYNIPAWRLRI